MIHGTVFCHPKDIYQCLTQKRSMVTSALSKVDKSTTSKDVCCSFFPICSYYFNRQQCQKILVPMKLPEIMASAGDIGVRSLPGCSRGHRLSQRRKIKIHHTLGSSSTVFGLVGGTKAQRPGTPHTTGILPSPSSLPLVLYLNIEMFSAGVESIDLRSSRFSFFSRRRCIFLLL
ncbi:unnamed protein product [Heterosigma akashiwo]